MNIELEMPSYEIAQITDLTVALEPVQENDYDSVWVGGAGVNLLPTDTVTHSSSDDTTHVTVFDGTLTGTYTISFDKSDVSSVGNKSAAVCSVVVDGVTKYVGYGVTSATYTGTITNVTVFSAASYCKYLGTLKIQLESGSTATSWTPYENICPITGHSEVKVYNGAVYGTADDTYTISLGGTYYGGTLDVTTGVLTVDRGYAAFVGASAEAWKVEQWQGQSNFYIAITNGKRPAYGDALISNLFSSSGVNGLQLGKIYISATGNLNCPVGSTIGATTVAELKTWLASNNLQVCYELATPTTIQLTAQNVETLTGINNVWSDSGDVTVTISGTTQTGDVVTVTALPQHKIQLFMP